MSTDFRDALYNSLLFIAGYLLVLVFNIYLLKYLSLADYGDYKIFESLSIICIPVLLFGGKEAINIFLPQYFAEKAPQKMAGIILFFMGIASIVFFILLLLSLIIRHGLWVDMKTHMVILEFLFIFPLIGMAYLLVHVINLMGKSYLSSTILNVGMPALLILAMATFVYFNNGSFTLRDVYFYYCLVMFFIMLFSAILIFHMLEATTSITAMSKAWLSTSIPVSLSVFLSNLLVQQDLILLGIMGKNHNEVGILGGCLTISTVIWIVYRAQSFWFIPKLSVAIQHKTENRDTLQKLVRQFNIMMFAVCGVLTTLIIIYAKPILGFFHAGLTIHSRLLLTLTIVYFLVGSISSANLLLLLDKRKKLLLILHAIVFVIVMALEISLIPPWGMWGAAVPLLLGRIALSGTAVYFCHKDYQISIF